MNKIIKIQYQLTNKEIKFLKSRYSIRELAEILKISPSYLCDIFNRERNIPEKRVNDFNRVLFWHKAKSNDLLNFYIENGEKFKFVKINNKPKLIKIIEGAKI